MTIRSFNAKVEGPTIPLVSYQRSVTADNRLFAVLFDSNRPKERGVRFHALKTYNSSIIFQGETRKFNLTSQSPPTISSNPGANTEFT
ncbi:hypothetical protein BST61_g4484 [Cercospora zeina]